MGITAPQNKQTPKTPELGGPDPNISNTHPLINEIGKDAFEAYSHLAKKSEDFKDSWLRRLGRGSEADIIKNLDLSKKIDVLQKKIESNLKNDERNIDEYLKDGKFHRNLSWHISQDGYSGLDQMMETLDGKGINKLPQKYQIVLRKFIEGEMNNLWNVWDERIIRNKETLDIYGSPLSIGWNDWEKAAELTAKINPKLAKERYNALGEYFQSDEVIRLIGRFGADRILKKSAEFFEKAGNTEKAEESWRKFIRYTTSDSERGDAFMHIGEEDTAEELYRKDAFESGVAFANMDLSNVEDWAARKATQSTREIRKESNREREHGWKYSKKLADLLGSSLEKADHNVRALAFYRAMANRCEEFGSDSAATYFWKKAMDLDVFSGKSVVEANTFFNKKDFGDPTNIEETSYRTFGTDLGRKTYGFEKAERKELAFKTGKLLNERTAEPTLETHDLLQRAQPNPELLKLYENNSLDETGRVVFGESPIQINGKSGNLGSLTFKWYDKDILEVDEGVAKTYVFDVDGNGITDAVYRETSDGKGMLIAERPEWENLKKIFPHRVGRFMRLVKKDAEFFNAMPGLILYDDISDKAFKDLEMEDSYDNQLKNAEEMLKEIDLNAKKIKNQGSYQYRGPGLFSSCATYAEGFSFKNRREKGFTLIEVSSGPMFGGSEDILAYVDKDGDNQVDYRLHIYKGGFGKVKSSKLEALPRSDVNLQEANEWDTHFNDLKGKLKVAEKK